MPRVKSRPDAEVLALASKLMHERGPEALTFASVGEAAGLSPATLVQRFGSKSSLKQQALLHAWDRLDERTADLAGRCPVSPEGAVKMLVAMSTGYGDIESYAEGLLILREDLRDPVLRARGASWKTALAAALEERLAGIAAGRPGLGLIMATQWQGSLLWWSFDPQGAVEAYVEAALRAFLARLGGVG